MTSSLTLGSSPVRRRRLRALVVVLAALTGMLSLTATSVPARAADPPSGTTVDGPIPGASVTIDHTKDLVNQVVQVSWKGFKPSSGTFLTDSTLNPVRVYQCKANPTSPNDCYGNTEEGLAGGSTDALGGIPEGPSNAQDALTAPDGTGSALVEVRTKLESPLLGCSSTSACSLVVVPNWGDPKDPTTTANIHQIDFPFAWANRVVVPITFAPAGELCGLGDADFQLVGSPMSSRVIQSWQPGGCSLSGAARFNLDYTALGEPDARAGFAAGTDGAVLTSEPLAGAAAHPYTYAPLSASGIAVAFHVDDAKTGQPISDMKVNARLIAKLITESYGWLGYEPAGQTYGNPNTSGNPYTMFTDPEFLKLNPGHSWPINPTATPLLLADNSDMTWELTRWINSDRDARAWLDGAPDPWGMKVNPKFQGITYPESSFELRDNYPALTYTFSPVSGLDQVARRLASNAFGGVSPDLDPLTNAHDKLPPAPPGTRAFVAIVDTGDAFAFRFPQAQVLNAAGDYVAPTADSMTAALGDMKPNGTSGTVATVAMDYSSTDAAAYPLTMVQYALVQTSGMDKTQADKIGRLLDYAAGAGQTSGDAVGNLPGGYVPLSDTLKAQTTKAATEVRAQVAPTPAPGGPPTGSDQPGTSGFGGTGSDQGTGPGSGFESGTPPIDGGGTSGPPDTPAASTPTGSANPQPTVAPSAKNSGSNASKPLTARLAPVAAYDSAKWALPLLLVLALTCLGLGPVLLMVSTGRVHKGGSRTRRLGNPFRRTGRLP